MSDDDAPHEPTDRSPAEPTSSRDSFERLLSEAREACACEVAGLFGPGSITWQVNREAVILLGGGAAALLQAAHPHVAHAVVDHSAALTDARGRLRRTLDAVYLMVFGDWRAARSTARRIRAIHEHIHGEIVEDLGCYRRGERYDANSVHAQRWVAATLMYTAVQVFERIVRPLSASEKDRLVAEHARFCALFGIPRSQCESSWSAFEGYWRRMIASDELAVGRHARLIAEGILSASDRVRWPLYRWLQSFTASLLPPRFRRAFGLPGGLTESALVALSERAIRLSHAMPATVRYVPAYLDARRRLAGLPGRNTTSAALWEAFYATLLPPGESQS